MPDCRLLIKNPKILIEMNNYRTLSEDKITLHYMLVFLVFFIFFFVRVQIPEIHV